MKCVVRSRAAMICGSTSVPGSILAESMNTSAFQAVAGGSNARRSFCAISVVGDSCRYEMKIVGLALAALPREEEGLRTRDGERAGAGRTATVPLEDRAAPVFVPAGDRVGGRLAISGLPS